MIFISKIGHPTDLDDFRSISLISVLAKWYMAGLMILVKRSVAQMKSWRWRRLMIFGFEENHSCVQITAGLTLLVQRGLEWRNQVPIFILSAIVKAL